MGPGYVTAGRGKAPLYRKRRPLPALIVFIILGLIAITVWVSALDTSIDRNEAVRCTPPANPPQGVTHEALPYDALDRITPVPPSRVQLRVLNAGDQRGQASITTEMLRDYNFRQIGQPTNDPLYPKQDLACRGQIRFGENGVHAARTMSIIEPCAELVRDNRADASVDLTVGDKFDDLHPTSEALTVFKKLEQWAAAHPVQRGGEQSEPKAQPKLDPALLTAARDVTC